MPSGPQTLEKFGRETRRGFRVWADRESSVCKVRTEGRENAEWLRSYLCSNLPGLKVTEPLQIDDTPLYRFDVTWTDQAPPWRIQKVLIECPKITLMRVFPVRIAEKPHYVVQAYNLAAWIEDQGDETWWRVDGDPLLMGRLESPCPPEEIAEELRRINRPLLVSDPGEAGAGEEVISQELSRLVDSEELGVPALYLSWRDGSTDWLLIQDEPADVPTDIV